MSASKEQFRSFGEVLSQFVTPQVWKQAHQSWQTDHRESRWGLRPLLWTLLTMSWCSGDSVDERFATARAVYVASHSSERRPGETSAGFLAALARLPMAVLRALARALRNKLGVQLVDQLRINGWLPMACDGTRQECPRSKELQRWLKLKPRKGKKPNAPMTYLTAMVLLPLGLPWAWRWGRANADERRHARDLLPTLPKQTLLIADSFYQSYDLFMALVNAGHGFLVRLSSKAVLWTDTKIQRTGFRDDLVYYWPEETARRKGLPPILARAIRIRGRKGKDVWLLTNVLDREQLSREAAGQLYRWRWRNEGMFRHYKCMLAKTKLMSRTVKQVHREAEGSMLALQLLLAHTVLPMAKSMVPKNITPSTMPEATPMPESKPRPESKPMPESKPRPKSKLKVVLTKSPRRLLLRIRGAITTSLRRLGPQQWQAYLHALEEVRSRRGKGTTPRVRQRFPRRAEHKPPGPPTLRMLDDTLKRLMQKCLDAA